MISILFCLLLSLEAFGSMAAEPLLSPGMNGLRSKLKLQKCGLSGQSVRFTEKEIDAVLGTKAEFIRVEELPTYAEGMLMLDGVCLGEGQLVARESFAGLAFVPADETVETVCFKISDASADVSVSCEVNLLNELNLAPRAEKQTFTTMEGLTLCKFLKASDPENDAICFRVSGYPAHGRVELDETGYFRYTPKSGYVGEDSFSYTATDCYGNQSEAVTAVIHVTDGVTETVYDDLTEHWAVNAVMRVSAEGLMSGTEKDGAYVFEPNGTVSRGDLLAMALIAAGKEASVEFTAQTVFADDASIPLNIKSYAEYARVNGIVGGVAAENGTAVFDSTKPITRAEAAVMLDRMLALPTASLETLDAFSDSATLPAWACQAMANVTACGLMNGVGYGELCPTEEVTRAQTAELLCNVRDYLEEKAEEAPKKKRTLWNLFGLLGE